MNSHFRTQSSPTFCGINIANSLATINAVRKMLTKYATMVVVVLLTIGCDRLNDRYLRDELGLRMNYNEFRALVSTRPNIDSYDCSENADFTELSSYEETKAGINTCVNNHFEQNKRAYGFLLNESGITYSDPNERLDAYVTTSTSRVFTIEFDSNNNPENERVYLLIRECRDPVLRVNQSTGDREIDCSSIRYRTSDEFYDAL